MVVKYHERVNNNPPYIGALDHCGCIEVESGLKL